MVTVVNGRIAGWNGCVYIGRAGHGQAGMFGNPFIVGVHGARGECVELFRRWFNSDDPRAVEMRNRAVREIPRDAILACFCKPASCHGDVIAEYLNSLPA